MSDIQHSLQIAVPPDAVYRLVSTAHGFAQWWAADVTEPDGAVELAFFNRTTVYRLRLTAGTPPTQADWSCETGVEWSGTQIVFHLTPTGAGTMLRFTHAGWQSATDYFVSCNTVWGELMFRLKSAAEGKPRGPLFLPGSMAD
jgi:uncharacterized protein YndB with AHSA1/START domain